MAQILKGKAFLVSANNGVTALASEVVVNEKMQRARIWDALMKSNIGKATGFDAGKAVDDGLRLAIGPIFTFTNPGRYASSPWFSGDTLVFDKLVAYIEAEGGIVLRQYAFYVPFSNGIETRYSEPERMRYELGYVTTTQDFVDEFGATRADIMGKYL